MTDELELELEDELDEEEDEALFDDLGDEEEEAEELESLSLEEIENDAMNTGAWVPVDLHLYRGEKRYKLPVELHVLPMSHPKVQSLFTKLTESYLRTHKKYKQLYAKGGHKALPPAVRQAITRQSFWGGALKGWRKPVTHDPEPIKGLPFNKENAKKFVEELFPHEFNTFVEAGADEKHFIKLRVAGAVENLAPASDSNQEKSSGGHTSSHSKNNSETISTPQHSEAMPTSS